MNSKNLQNELEQIDAAIAELEDRRTCLINRMTCISGKDVSIKVLHFPGRVSETRPPRGSAEDWPKGSPEMK